MNDLAESNGREKLGSKIARESFSDEPSFGKKKKKKDWGRRARGVEVCEVIERITQLGGTIVWEWSRV